MSIASAALAEAPEDEPQAEAPTLFDIACPDGLELEPYEVTRQDWAALVQGVSWLRDFGLREMEYVETHTIPDIDADLDPAPPLEVEDFLWNMLHKAGSLIDLNDDGVDEIYISTFPVSCTNGNWACPIWFLDSDNPRHVLFEGYGQCVTLGPPNEEGWHDVWVVRLVDGGYDGSDGSIDQVTQEFRAIDGHYQNIGERRTQLRAALVE